MNPRRHSFVFWLISRSRTAKKTILFSIDIFIGIVSVWLAFYVRTEDWNISAYSYDYVIALVIVISAPVFYLFGLYRQIMRYLDSHLLASMLKVFAVYGALFSIIVSVVGITNVPRSIGIIQPIIFFVLLLLEKIFLGSVVKMMLVGANQKQKIKILIYGAGSAGRKLAEAYRNNGVYKIHGFIDDDMGLHGNSINGLKVCSLLDFYDNHLGFGVSEVWLAIPSIEKSVRKKIVSRLSKLGVHVRTAQGFMRSNPQGNYQIDLHELDLDDLIDREEVPPDLNLLQEAIEGSVVLITGAGGSIGGEIVRQAIPFGPKKIILLDHSEFNLYLLLEQIQDLKNCENLEIIPILGSIKNIDFISNIFEKYSPDVVFHTAAYKHVPLVEANITEAVSTNVFGTKNCVEISLRCGVKKFILVSTDKAVRPTSIMGASKRVAELILQAVAAEPSAGNKTAFSIVRFGNVLNSSGSVVPLFRRQIASGGPITLTHKEVTRYFMSIPEAAQLVIQSAAMAKGGEVFVLDMGDPIQIYDLAKRMVSLSGLTIRDFENDRGDIEIKIVGLRPGEKLHEELLIGKVSEKTIHTKVSLAKENFVNMSTLNKELNVLEDMVNKFRDIDVAAILWRLVGMGQ